MTKKEYDEARKTIVEQYELENTRQVFQYEKTCQHELENTRFVIELLREQKQNTLEELRINYLATLDDDVQVVEKAIKVEVLKSIEELREQVVNGEV